MVITAYADRRTPAVVDIAGRLAHAFGLVVGHQSVMLLAPATTGEAGHASVRRSDELRARPSHDVAPLLRDLSNRYAITVVAISGAPNERVLAAFDASDRVLLLSEPSVAAIRSTQRALRLCTSLGYGLDKTAIVLHGVGDDAPLAPPEAAAALKRDIFWVIPGAVAGDVARDEAFARLAARLIGTP